MQNPRLASRYAKSLVDLALEQSQLEPAYADMKLLASIANTNPDVVNLLKSPIIKADKKNKILAAILTGQVSALTSSFITLLVNKGRESVLPEIAHAFIDQYQAIKHIHKVKITTAQPLDQASLAALTQHIQDSFPGQALDIVTEVKESLIGGFLLETGNQLFDGSVSRSLEELRKNFSGNAYVPAIH
ncbi:ATP synthase F1 subcomplex delta subunit [Chitinophaga costaii]|uniref:ATP synthase subunit delta n=1 Tax=Chitinophaga costaii TaxID=1335309 RepID=A0A1C4F469_9BACT|nr:ATP synthase F1 subunit delta [Chitinophaga costaii]PUZ22079.1 ATP synthase F1 subunit delta [Chitinophaga costaii]SCC50644.1 ATP synthase F1 subcomplex delta subunit [Chitinophaga costaii]